MGRKSRSIDQINSYIIDNLAPYAWSNLWELTDLDSRGYFRFIMILRPNEYERHFVYHAKDNGMIEDHSIPSSNSFDLPDPEYFQSFGICIPMILGSAVTKQGIPLDDDAKSKHTYISRLAKNTYDSIQEMSDVCSPKINSIKEIFGLDRGLFDRATGWERFEAYCAKMPRHVWTLINPLTDP